MSGRYICGEEGREGQMKEERRRGGGLFYSLQDHPPGKDVTCYSGAFNLEQHVAVPGRN